MESIDFNYWGAILSFIFFLCLTGTYVFSVVCLSKEEHKDVVNVLCCIIVVPSVLSVIFLGYYYICIK